MERVVKSRVTDHLTSNKLLNLTPTSLLTVHIIPLKQPSYTSIIIHQYHSNYHVCVSSTLWLLLTPLTVASYVPASHLGSVSMPLSSTGLSRTCHLVPSISVVIALFCPSIPPPVASPKAPLLVLCFSSCTLPPQHSYLLPFPQPSPLCRRHPTLFLILPAQLWLKHHPPAECFSANFCLDDCQSPNSQCLQDWILTHWTQKATWQDTQLLT